MEMPDYAPMQGMIAMPAHLANFWFLVGNANLDYTPQPDGAIIPKLHSALSIKDITEVEHISTEEHGQVITKQTYCVDESFQAYFKEQLKFDNVLIETDRLLDVIVKDNRYYFESPDLAGNYYLIDPKQLKRKRMVIQDPNKQIRPKTRLLILHRDNYTCQKCGYKAGDIRNGETVKIDVDHIIPRAKGGLTTEDNLECLCTACNRAKSDIILS